MNLPKVTVIMRSKNSEWVIGQSLIALFSQNYSDFDLIVVDSGSTDGTIQIVEKFPANIIKIEGKDYFPADVLNMAIERTEGEIIVFQNSDAVPLIPTALEKILGAFQDKKVVAAFARQIPRPEAERWVKREYRSCFPDSKNPPSWITLSLPFSAMRKDAWRQHHFYSDSWGSEDTEWGYWAKKNNFKVKYVKDALVMHSHNYSLPQIYGRKFIEGEADAFIYRDNYTLSKAVKQFCGAVLKDFLAAGKDLSIKEICKAPIRRFVHFWAYYKARKFGKKRILLKTRDRKRAQQEILNRYEK
ncbi:MAG: glycosyltransferase family 2 protein [Candidatus Cloacimonadota bacterium]|nr:glycosyltransferase family 2 protein [Candidatus Cloacimonadota bacterium]